MLQVGTEVVKVLVQGSPENISMTAVAHSNNLSKFTAHESDVLMLRNGDVPGMENIDLCRQQVINIKRLSGA